MKRNNVKVVDKPWGREIWLAVETEYAGKILEIDKGHRLSLQYHERKKESLYVLKGKGKFTVKGEEFDLEEGDSITIDPRDTHRIEALTDIRLVEVSTPELEDVIRVEDDYDR